MIIKVADALRSFVELIPTAQLVGIFPWLRSIFKLRCESGNTIKVKHFRRLW
ncbi:MAG: hypothetical protein GXO83_03190 [Chlorobi bacterium]|nr:hypothetical protein [Chlorobiota bacterium]